MDSDRTKGARMARWMQPQPLNSTSDTSMPYSQGLGIVCSALGAIEGGI